MDRYKEIICIIIFISFWAKDGESRYYITDKEDLAILKCPAKVWWLVSDSKYLSRFYKDNSDLESIFI